METRHPRKEEEGVRWPERDNAGESDAKEIFENCLSPLNLRLRGLFIKRLVPATVLNQNAPCAWLCAPPARNKLQFLFLQSGHLKLCFMRFTLTSITREIYRLISSFLYEEIRSGGTPVERGAQQMY